MKVIGETDHLPQGSTVATIGMFDGVHLGHATLIDFLKQQASSNNRPAPKASNHWLSLFCAILVKCCVLTSLLALSCH